MKKSNTILNTKITYLTRQVVYAFLAGLILGGAALGFIDAYAKKPLFSNAQVGGTAGMGGSGVGAVGSIRGQAAGGGVSQAAGGGIKGQAYGGVKNPSTTKKTSTTKTSSTNKTSSTTSNTKVASTTGTTSTTSSSTTKPQEGGGKATTPKAQEAAAQAKKPGNLNTSTGETVDESGASGFVICGNTVDTPCNITHLFRTLIIIINYLISMAGLIAVLFIIINGVRMVASQGTLPAKESDQSELTKAKKGLTGAVIGLVLVAVAFVLVNSLLAGSLNIGIRNGALILSNPKEYINEGNTPQSEINPATKPVTQTQGTPEKPPAEPGK